MKRIKLTLTMTLLFNSIILFSQKTEMTESKISNEEIASLHSSETKMKNQNTIKSMDENKVKEKTASDETIIETKLLPIKDLMVVDLPENSTSIVVMQRNGKFVNEILCNPEDKKLTMDFSYLPKGNYTLKFQSTSNIKYLFNFKKGRVKYQ